MQFLIYLWNFLNAFRNHSLFARIRCRTYQWIWWLSGIVFNVSKIFGHFCSKCINIQKAQNKAHHKIMDDIFTQLWYVPNLGLSVVAQRFCFCCVMNICSPSIPQSRIQTKFSLRTWKNKQLILLYCCINNFMLYRFS